MGIPTSGSNIGDEGAVQSEPKLGGGSSCDIASSSSAALLDDFCERYLICPITLELFRDPVVAADGETYERAAITAWLSRPAPGFSSGHCTSPLTRRPLPNKHLSPNNKLRRMAREWRAAARGHDGMTFEEEDWAPISDDEPNFNGAEANRRLISPQAADPSRTTVLMVTAVLLGLLMAVVWAHRYPSAQQHIESRLDGSCHSGLRTNIVPPEEAPKGFLYAREIAQRAQWLFLYSHRRWPSQEAVFSLKQQEAFPDSMTSEKGGVKYYVKLADFVSKHPRGSAERSLVEAQVEHFYEIIRGSIGAARRGRQQTGATDVPLLLMPPPPHVMTFSLDPGPQYPDAKQSTRHCVRYFVSNETGQFDLVHPEGSAARALVEARVEMELKMRLQTRCHWELLCKSFERSFQWVLRSKHHQQPQSFADDVSGADAGAASGERTNYNDDGSNGSHHGELIDDDRDLGSCEKLKDLWPAAPLGPRWLQETPWPPPLHKALWAAISLE